MLSDSGEQARGVVPGLVRPSSQIIEWRFKTYPLALIAVLVLATMFIIKTEDVQVGGDFPAFYGAGHMVWSGDMDALYEPDRQIEAQSDLPISTEPGGLYFAYPPIVATLFAPLGALPFIDAYALYTLILVAATAFAVRIGWAKRPNVSGRTSLVLLLVLAFAPVFRAIIGSQTTTLYVLLFALLTRELERQDQSELSLAALLTLSLFKPQLGLPLIGLVVIHDVRRNWRPATMAAAAFYLLNTLVAGFGWFGVWISALADYNSLPGVQDSPLSISWVGALTSAVDWPGAEALGFGLAAVTVVILMLVWRPETPVPVRDRMSLTMPGILLLSPHTVFYEAGLILFTLLNARSGRRATLLVLFVVAAVSWVEPVGIRPLVHPNFWLILAAFVYALVTLVQRRRS